MTLKEIHSGHVLFGTLQYSVYSLLRHMESGLMLDVGAAAGMITKLMLEVSPTSHVIAFEPFPGNTPHFEKTVGQDSRVTLHKTAVCDQAGDVCFFVSSVVTGNERGWEEHVGYSSLGYVVENSSPKAGTSITVPAITLSEQIKEHVRFCKIDVQGGEESVIRGATQLIQSHGVDIFYVEFGDRNEPILQFLSELGYIFFDNPYLLIPTRNKPLETQWNIEKPVALSTGKEAYYAWPRNAPRPFDDYCAWLHEETKKIGWVQTDMVCVHQSFMPEFLEAIAKSLRLEASVRREGE
jgi:FkbM family methyltransferase